MLNIELLEGEGFPFHTIVFFSIAKQNNWEWEIRENKKGG
jgi:hypothetical protein